jgi:hypothetical protein
MTVSEIIPKLRSIAIDSLTRMYRPQERLFAFRIRKKDQGEILEGVSCRYTATVLIGLAGENEQVIVRVLGDHSLKDVCDYLIRDIDRMKDLGEVALTVWAARAIKHPLAQKAVKALERFDLEKNAYTAPELSWALTSLSIQSDSPADKNLAKNFAEKLISTFNPESAVFSHGSVRKVSNGLIKRKLSSLFTHVSCFADFVYPIQALSYYYNAAKDSRAIDIACRCAEHMCELQGKDGQWWWHYDNRTGCVIERYPVYSVHQDAMAPMALFALERYCGKAFPEAIEKSLNWLIKSPEISGSLIDDRRNIIWRKVFRREPRKLVRAFQAFASRIHPDFRLPAVETVFPPVAIDYETRPYEMGWILHAWSNKKVVL